LLGVAIGDANLVSDAEHHVVSSLQARDSAIRGQEDVLQSQLGQRNQFEQEAVAGLLANRLNRRSIGLIFLGDPIGQLDQLAAQAVNEAGGRLASVVAVREPQTLAALGKDVANTRYGALAADPTLLRPFAARIGAELGAGSGRLLTLAHGDLFSSDNWLSTPVQGVVLVRNDANAAPAVQSEIATFDSGLAGGLLADGIPVVGVEISSTNPSNIGWYTEQGFSSVDDLDDIAGRTALVFTLLGAKGAFGFKGTASAILPALPLTATTVGP